MKILFRSLILLSFLFDMAHLYPFFKSEESFLKGYFFNDQLNIKHELLCTPLENVLNDFFALNQQLEKSLMILSDNQYEYSLISW